jgi:transcriptional regulator with PAS, ATPase and Fis domain
MKMRRQMEALIEEMLDGQILLGEAISEFEKLYIEKCMERNNKHISKSADVLGIHRNTLSKRIATYNKKPLKSMVKRR